MIKLSSIGISLIALAQSMEQKMELDLNPTNFNNNLLEYMQIELPNNTLIPNKKPTLPIKKNNYFSSKHRDNKNLRNIYRQKLIENQGIDEYQILPVLNQNSKTPNFCSFESAQELWKDPRFKTKGASTFLNIAQDKKFKTPWRFIAAETLWKDLEFKKEGAQAYLSLATDINLMTYKRLNAAKILLSYKEDSFFISQATQIIKNIFQMHNPQNMQSEEEFDKKKFLNSCINELGEQHPTIQEIITVLEYEKIRPLLSKLNDLQI